MAEKEITLQSEDGQLDETVLTTHDQATCNSLEDCVRMLFPQEGEAKPRLRFKGFDEEWVTTKLCEISKKITTKNTDLRYRITLTNSAEKGIINQLDYFDHDVSNGDNISGYYVVENDDFVYNPRISATAPVGPINRNQLGYTGVMSPLYYVFRVDGIDKDYLSYFFKTTLWHKFMFDNGNNGARYDRFSIADDVFGQMPIIHPKDIEEQRLIASFFRRLDEQIATQQKQLERLKQMKQSCLGLLFPDNQSITPPLRFKGFNGEWIMIRLSDMAQRISTSGVSDKLPSVEFEDIVSGEGVLNKDVNRKNVVKRGVKFEKHDVLFGKLRPYLKNILYADFNGIAVGDFWVLRASEAVDPYFLYILVSTHQFMSVANISSGSKMPRADWNLVSNSSFAIPPSIDEQRSIASFFRNLDGHINSKSQQVEKLKQVKKACLNKFIA